MADIGYGYGSEWHLLRFLGYHRNSLDSAILYETGGQQIEWLDFPFNQAKKFYDDDWKGLNFLYAKHPARQQWSKYWPTTGNVPNWDAVGRLRNGGQDEWLLVEAKAHIGEIKSSCGASERGGLPTIRSAFEVTKRNMAIDQSNDWLRPFYQYANRLATLDFLLQRNVLARLLFIYFLGDKHQGAKCPQTVAEWMPALQESVTHLGLTGTSDVEARTHSVFLRVNDGKSFSVSAG